MKNDVGELFQRTLPESEPRLAYSADETVTAGRRRRNRFRLAAAGGGGLAVVAATAVSLALLPGAASPAPQDDGGTANKQAAEQTEPEDDKGEREKLAQELAELISVGHDSGVVKPHSSSDEFELGWFDDSTGDWETGEGDHYELRTFAYDGEVFSGMVTVAIYSPGSFHDKPMEVGAGEDPEGTLIYCARDECAKSTTEDGDTRYEQEGSPGQRGIMTDNVLEVRADGTGVLVSSTCGDLGKGRDGEQLNCEQPMLTVEDMSAIAAAVPDVTGVFED